jgi:hypothetical protein
MKPKTKSKPFVVLIYGKNIINASSPESLSAETSGLALTNRVSKSSCRTAKRPQPDRNRTEKDRTAVASCLASATDQLQVASSREKIEKPVHNRL